MSKDVRIHTPVGAGLLAAEELRPHAGAGAIPVMSESEYTAFRDDVRRNGILVPLDVTSAKVVLDGRQRLRAAREVGLEMVPVRVVGAENEPEYMLRAAVLRRQLTPAQRVALVLEFERYTELRAEGKERQLANLSQAGEVASLPPRGKTRDLVAALAGASARTAQDVALVHEHDPELFERVKGDELGAANAARKVRRALRDRALPTPPALPTGPFEVIYADPPWPMGNPEGPHSPECHYPTMPLEEIKALEVPAADDAVLFLWVVTSLLPQAFEVIAAWGFAYKSAAVWVKETIGPGVWLRNRFELLLVARRGSFPPPQPEDRVDSVIEAPRRRHSQKPALLYELIERMYPNASKLELFARERRPGWAAWGNEVPA